MTWYLNVSFSRLFYFCLCGRFLLDHGWPFPERDIHRHERLEQWLHKFSHYCSSWKMSVSYLPVLSQISWRGWFLSWVLTSHFLKSLLMSLVLAHPQRQQKQMVRNLSLSAVEKDPFNFLEAWLTFPTLQSDTFTILTHLRVLSCFSQGSKVRNVL